MLPAIVNEKEREIGEKWSMQVNNRPALTLRTRLTIMFPRQPALGSLAPPAAKIAHR